MAHPTPDVKPLPRTGTARRDIYDWMVDNAGDGMTAKEVQAGMGMYFYTFNSAMTHLRNNGWVKRTGEKKGTSWLLVAHIDDGCYCSGVSHDEGCSHWRMPL